jgi:hypothetical protein
MNRRVVFIQVDDWYGLYVDGKLIDEGHIINAMEMLEIAEKNAFTYSDVICRYLESNDKNYDIIEQSGRMPKELSAFTFKN